MIILLEKNVLTYHLEKEVHPIKGLWSQCYNRKASHSAKCPHPPSSVL